MWKKELRAAWAEVLRPALASTVTMNLKHNSAYNYILMRLQNVVDFEPSPALHWRDKHCQGMSSSLSLHIVVLGKMFAPAAHALLWGLALCLQSFHPAPLLLRKFRESSRPSSNVHLLREVCPPLALLMHPWKGLRVFFAVHHQWVPISPMTHILVSSAGKQQSMVAVSSGLEPEHTEAWTLFPPVTCEKALTCSPRWVSVSQFENPAWLHFLVHWIRWRLSEIMDKN